MVGRQLAGQSITRRTSCISAKTPTCTPKVERKVEFGKWMTSLKEALEDSKGDRQSAVTTGGVGKRTFVPINKTQTQELLRFQGTTGTRTYLHVHSLHIEPSRIPHAQETHY